MSNLEFSSVIGSATIHSTPWFDDGTVIIETENTRFRVYRGVLATASPVLKDMFDDASGTKELVEGCPLVYVNESAQDWQFVLQALFERRYVYTQTHSVPFAIVSAFMRIGWKYQIQQLYDDGKKRLLFEFPTSLNVRDTMRHDDMIENPGEGEKATIYFFDVIQLARELDITAVLPWAYYLAAVSPKSVREILYGLPRPDQSSKVSLLSPDDQKAVIFGREVISKWISEHTWAWLRGEGSVHCATRSQCAARRADLIEIIFAWPKVPLLSLALMRWIDGIEASMCEHCTDVAKQAFATGRESIWDNLPGAFGLQPWNELLDVDSEVRFP